MELEEKLVPARPDVAGGGVRAKVPWFWLLGGVSALALFVAGYVYRSDQEVLAQRQALLQSYEQLRPAAERYARFRAKLEGWISTAAARPAGRHVDPRLRVSALHSGNGLYLRILAREAGNPEAIERAARRMRVDTITRCLGIAPASVRGMYERADILMPAWLRPVHEATSQQRLRALGESLQRRAAQDLPAIANLMQSQYFLLVLQQGESRRTSPVDVFLWDLRHDQLLLSNRIQSHGVLLPVRLAVKGVPIVAAPPPRVDSPGAADCSIAAEIKAMTGEEVISIGSMPSTAPVTQPGQAIP